MLKPKSRADKRQVMELLVSTFEQNYNQILVFLSQHEHQSVKLVCRGIYYISITTEVWTGLRLEVLDRKMELFEDLDFVDQQPKIISKQEKQIRIHSLKKNTPGTRLREASNIKEKKVALNTINNELPFRSTEIGFKRLLKSSLPLKQKIISTKDISNVVLDLVEIPKQWSSIDLIIDVKDPWSTNLHRADNLCKLARKWNEFHHRVRGDLKEVEKDLASLVKKCIKADRNITDYLKLFQNEPYKAIRQLFEGAQKQLLIDDQLNKLGKIFVKNHQELTNIGQCLQSFISAAHQSCGKLNKQHTQGNDTWILQGLSAVEELIQEWIKTKKSCPELICYLAKSILQIVDSMLEDFNSAQLQVAGQYFPLLAVNVYHLSRKSDFFSVLFQSYQSVCGGILKLCEGGEQQNMGLSLTVGKFKNLKLIAHHLWNMAKYFSKLTKQIEAREKKGSTGGKALIIRNFLQSYETYKAPYFLLDWKSPSRAEKQVLDLKQRVSGLKGVMQGD